MNKIKEYKEKMFEDIKHIDEEGNEYWSARELMPLLEYTLWQRFSSAIKKAIENCKNSNNNVMHHFIGTDKMVSIGSNTTRNIIDYKLSRYACYLIVLNCDARKRIIALAKTYFAIQTRKGNYSLNMVARNAGVRNFDKFHNAGYKGLYGGETANDIAKRKKLRYREDILDNMGSEELAANLFRITQTESKLKRDNISSENDANETHYNIGKNIRKVIAKNGGTMPENLPTPEKSLKELEKENKKLIVSK